MTGKKNLDLIIVGISILLGLLTLGVFVYTNIVYQRPLVNEAEEKDLLSANLKSGVSTDGLKIDKIVVNLRSETSRLRFLEVSLQVLPFKNEQKELLEKNSPLILDRIGQLATNMTPNDLNTISGKILFEERLKNKLNKDLGKQIVREIFFTGFVVQ